MGKKIKVDINGKPLEAITIGQIKKSKYGWIGTILLFVLFIGIIYFLPELSKYYQEYIKGNKATDNSPVNNTSSNTTNMTNTTTPDIEEDETDSVASNIYAFGTDMSVIKGDLEFSQISLVNDVLSFTITNKSTKTVDTAAENLYFETYDANGEEKNTLNTISIMVSIASGETVSLSYEIKSGALYYDIREITEDDYTYIVLEPDENNIATLTCNKANETLIYKFKNDKLININHSVSLLKSDINYDSLYNKYHEIVIKYGSDDGITASLSTNVTSMTFNMEIDYNTFKSNIDYDYYFAKDTSSRILNFKMEAILFDCK